MRCVQGVGLEAETQRLECEILGLNKEMEELRRESHRRAVQCDQLEADNNKLVMSLRIADEEARSKMDEASRSSALQLKVWISWIVCTVIVLE